MEAPTTQAEIKAAYRNLYTTTANAMQAEREMTAAKYALKDAEGVVIASGLLPGKNADERAANLALPTADERAEYRRAEDAAADANIFRALAQIAVHEIRELLRLAEWDNTAYYRDAYYRED